MLGGQVRLFLFRSLCIVPNWDIAFAIAYYTTIRPNCFPPSDYWGDSGDAPCVLSSVLSGLTTFMAALCTSQLWLAKLVPNDPPVQQSSLSAWSHCVEERHSASRITSLRYGQHSFHKCLCLCLLPFLRRIILSKQHYTHSTLLFWTLSSLVFI